MKNNIHDKVFANYAKDKIKEFLKDVNFSRPTNVNVYLIIDFLKDVATSPQEKTINKWWHNNIKRKNIFGDKLTLVEAISEYV